MLGMDQFTNKDQIATLLAQATDWANKLDRDPQALFHLQWLSNDLGFFINRLRMHTLPSSEAHVGSEVELPLGTPQENNGGGLWGQSTAIAPVESQQGCLSQSVQLPDNGNYDVWAGSHDQKYETLMDEVLTPATSLCASAITPNAPNYDVSVSISTMREIETNYETEVKLLIASHFPIWPNEFPACDRAQAIDSAYNILFKPSETMDAQRLFRKILKRVFTQSTLDKSVWPRYKDRPTPGALPRGEVAYIISKVKAGLQENGISLTREEIWDESKLAFRKLSPIEYSTKIMLRRKEARKAKRNNLDPLSLALQAAEELI